MKHEVTYEPPGYQTANIGLEGYICTHYHIEGGVLCTWNEVRDKKVSAMYTTVDRRWIGAACHWTMSEVADENVCDCTSSLAEHVRNDRCARYPQRATLPRSDNPTK